MTTAKRRLISNADKRRIVLVAAASAKSGEIAALSRRKGVHSSSLTNWSRQYAAGELSGVTSKKLGSKADPARAELKEMALVTGERDKLRLQLSDAQSFAGFCKSLRRPARGSRRPTPSPRWAAPDSHDNALTVTINGLYKTELVRKKGPWKTIEALGWKTLALGVQRFNQHDCLNPSVAVSSY